MDLKNKTVKELQDMLDDNYEEQKYLSEKHDDKIDELEQDKYDIQEEIERRPK